MTDFPIHVDRICMELPILYGHKIAKKIVKLQIFSYPSFLAYVLGAQKNRLIETVLLGTHNICFG